MSESMCRHQREQLLGIPQTGAGLTRQERLLIAIWDAWKDERVLTISAMKECSGHRSRAGVHAMLQTLVKHGWLRTDVVTTGNGRYGFVMHKYLPGPKFGGVASGHPLRIIEDEEQQTERRLSKYERRSVLFEVKA